MKKILTVCLAASFAIAMPTFAFADIAGVGPLSFGATMMLLYFLIFVVFVVALVLLVKAVKAIRQHRAKNAKNNDRGK